MDIPYITLDKCRGLCYSKYMNVRHKSITIEVPTGATKEWVIAQRSEMYNRLLSEAPSGYSIQLRKQWTDKARGRFMTVLADYTEVSDV